MACNSFNKFACSQLKFWQFRAIIGPAEIIMKKSEISNIGIIGDVHCEDEFLERVLKELAQHCDLLLCVGDVADGRGSFDRCCSLLRKL